MTEYLESDTEADLAEEDDEHKPLVSSSSLSSSTTSYSSPQSGFQRLTDHAKTSSLAASEKTWTVEQGINQLGTGKFQTRMTLITGSIWASEAMEVMLLTFLVPKLGECWDLSRIQRGMIASMVFLGVLIGNVIFTVISDRIGRRMVLQWVCLGSALFGSISALSLNLSMMLITRFLVGIFIGGGTVSTSYFTEISPSSQRGSLFMRMSFAWSIGALGCTLLAWLSFQLLNWRWYLLMISIPLWIVWMISFYLPESPRFLSAHLRMDEARKVLDMMANDNGRSLPEGVLVADDDDNNGRLDSGSRMMIKNVDSIKDVFRWDVFGMGLPMTFLLFNTTVSIYYGCSFLSEEYFRRDAGGRDLGLFLPMVLVTISEFPGMLIGYVFLDSWGRTRTMTMCYLMFSLGVFAAVSSRVRRVAWLGLTCLFLARLSACLAFNTLYVYINEFYPTSIRPTALGCISATARFTGILSSFLATGTEIDTGLVFFGAISAVSVGFTLLLPYDTTHCKLSDTVESYLIQRGRSKNKGPTSKV